MQRAPLCPGTETPSGLHGSSARGGIYVNPASTAAGPGGGAQGGPGRRGVLCTYHRGAENVTKRGDPPGPEEGWGRVTMTLEGLLPAGECWLWMEKEEAPRGDPPLPAPPGCEASVTQPRGVREPIRGGAVPSHTRRTPALFQPPGRCVAGEACPKLGTVCR